LNDSQQTHISHCPLCQGESFRAYLSVKDHAVSGELFELVKCSTCGFIMTNPRPASPYLGKYYDSETYISHSQSRKGLINSLYQGVKRINLYLKFRAIRSFVPRGTWVDYGAGTGDFVNFIAGKGIDIRGFEPNSKARDRATRNSVSLLHPERFSDLEPQSAACITLWHVLEHIPDFTDIISQFSAALMNDGILVLALPNCGSYDARHYESYWAAYDVPRHLWHFKQKDVEHLAHQSGFRVIQTLGMPFDAFYVSMLSEKYRSRSPLFGVYHGMKSNIWARFSSYPYSSQIYLLKKTS
jgi:2-polyprenyl-3-methyl-5-hydroxy-6-metoxy-1,4-benzoquinol methylase